MMRRVRLIPLLLAVVLAGCGSDTPTEPSPGPDTLTILGQSDFVTIGTVLNLRAALSSASATTVPADWSTDDGRVAGINRDGQMTALASGTTTVRAVYQQRTASFAVRVAPNFAGTWSGRARVTACTNPTPSVCQAYAVGTQHIARVTLVQNRDQVIGTLYAPYPASLPTIPPLVVQGTLQGTIELGGRLPMTGTLAGPTPTSPPIGAVTGWSTEIDSTQPILRGSYNEVTNLTSGVGTISWEFVGLTR